MTSALMYSRLKQVCDKEAFNVEPNSFYIYVLLDPITQEIRYVGKCKNIHKRLAGHISALYRNTHKENWIRGLLAQNKRPEILAIWSEEDEDTIIQDEIDFITLSKYLGLNLTNGTNGGVGSSGRIVSENTKQKIRQSQIGKKQTEEAKIKIGLSQIGNKHSLGVFPSIETKEKISNSLKGKKRSKETRVKLSLSKIGNKNPFYGRKHSSEEIAKIREYSIGSSNRNSILNEDIVKYIKTMHRRGMKRKDLFNSFKPNAINITTLDNVRYNRNWRHV